MTLDPAIQSYYDRRPEESRLERGPSQLEAFRTRSLIERYAPAAPAVVLDVGGAAGAYASWLSETGYAVHLVDAAARLVAEAHRRSRPLRRPIASCLVGDARALPFASAVADVVLLLGPLYHLTTTAGRSQALSEVARVLRPGGVLFAAAISRWASALDGLARDLFADPEFSSIAAEDLRTGQHRNPTDRAGYFTTAFFHRPEELREEVARAGLDEQGLYGLEGPGGILPDFDDRWADPRRRADMIRVAEAVECEPALLGLSSHLLVVARKAV